MKYAVVCAGGPEVAELSEFQIDETIFIGADRGAFHLLEKGIIPEEAVGDFDSVSREEYKVIRDSVLIVDRYRSEKDETDTELAVSRALTYKPEHVVLTGVTGGRLDHTEAALHLLYRLQTENPAISFSIRNETNELSMLLPTVHEVTKKPNYPYVSFFPFGGKVTGLTLIGFKYETLNETLETGMTKFTSNETASSNCTISFHEGICLMVRSSDA
ncbi:thiamine diphosphokinase [Sporosarcina sp. G11-34]|uniref:thiamine diphosphokinase n=1 Tax=Sporosarcina sp. G11-34 TaxID=2849605 RepID=UPI0022A9D36C|nr:thiamine diphosphokinase [Sporosarcina sp. G11-34]MCZ2257070.1 thiamine diphosphokinase [Sporosarcina sp. G11-34]